MKLNDIYRSDERYDKMGAAQRIVDWYDEVYDMGGHQKDVLDKLLGAHNITGEDPDVMFSKLIQLDDRALNKLYRNIKNAMGKSNAR